MTNEQGTPITLPVMATDLVNVPDDHLAAGAQHLAQYTVDADIAGDFDQDSVANVLQEVADRLMVRALADEGIGQRPPVALLVWGHESDPTGEDYAGYLDARDQLTLAGHIVLEHEFMAEALEAMDEGDRGMMAQLLTQKVKMADVVNVYNPSGEVTDEDAQAALAAAAAWNTPVQYTIPPTQ